jgi:hypothetical protein
VIWGRILYTCTRNVKFLVFWIRREWIPQGAMSVIACARWATARLPQYWERRIGIMIKGFVSLEANLMLQRGKRWQISISLGVVVSSMEDIAKVMEHANAVLTCHARGFDYLRLCQRD